MNALIVFFLIATTPIGAVLFLIEAFNAGGLEPAFKKFEDFVSSILDENE